MGESKHENLLHFLQSYIFVYKISLWIHEWYVRACAKQMVLLETIDLLGTHATTILIPFSIDIRNRKCRDPEFNITFYGNYGETQYAIVWIAILPNASPIIYSCTSFIGNFIYLLVFQYTFRTYVLSYDNPLTQTSSTCRYSGGR